MFSAFRLWITCAWLNVCHVIAEWWSHVGLDNDGFFVQYRGIQSAEKWGFPLPLSSDEIRLLKEIEAAAKPQLKSKTGIYVPYELVVKNATEYPDECDDDTSGVKDELEQEKSVPKFVEEYDIPRNVAWGRNI